MSYGHFVLVAYGQKQAWKTQNGRESIFVNIYRIHSVLFFLHSQWVVEHVSDAFLCVRCVMVDGGVLVPAKILLSYCNGKNRWNNGITSPNVITMHCFVFPHAHLTCRNNIQKKIRHLHVNWWMWMRLYNVIFYVMNGNSLNNWPDHVIIVNGMRISMIIKFNGFIYNCTIPYYCIVSPICPYHVVPAFNNHVFHNTWKNTNMWHKCESNVMESWNHSSF